MSSDTSSVLEVSRLTVPREVSKKRHIHDTLLSRIKDNSLPVGTRLPSATVLAAEWQVAYATVHSALNELTRSGWLTRLPKQGTFVSAPPKGKDDSLFVDTISVALAPRDDIATAGYGNEVFEMLQGLTDGAGQHGRQIRIESLPTSPSFAETERAFASMRLSAHSVFIGTQYLPIIKRLVEAGNSVTTLATDPKCGNFITYDREAALRLAVDHLTARGCRKIAFLGNSRDTKFQAYREALRTRDLPWEESRSYHCIGVRECREQIGRFLDSRPDCDSIFIPNYQVASAFYRAAVARGIRMPEDIALIGQGIAEHGINDVPLSYVRVPYLEFGIEAMKDIVRGTAKAGDDARQIRVLQPELIIRDSA